MFFFSSAFIRAALTLYLVLTILSGAVIPVWFYLMQIGPIQLPVYEGRFFSANESDFQVFDSFFLLLKSHCSPFF